MSTARRLYLYGLALISSEVVIWGLVRALRTITAEVPAGAGSLLSNGLSLALVGAPIFIIHWRMAQREAMRDPAERASQGRAVFFYTALLITLIPIVFAVTAILHRGMTELFDLPATSVWFGRAHSYPGHLIAGLINGVALAFFWMSLRADWQSDIPENHLRETRRLYRYLWVLGGLVLAVTGAYHLLRYGIYLLGQVQSAATLAGGLALLMAGAPLWLWHWQAVEISLKDAEERNSFLRLVVLYLIALAGVIGVATLAGTILSSLLNRALGESRTLGELLIDNGAVLGGLVPLVVTTGYYGRILAREVTAVSEEPRRPALRRLYHYLQAFIGLMVTLVGCYALVDVLSQLVFAGFAITDDRRSLFSGGLSSLLVGIPLWLYAWRKMQAETSRQDAAGDSARRSVLRKSYLYMVLFVLVLAGMVLAGLLINVLLEAVLSGSPQSDLGAQVLRFVLALAIVTAFLVYHLRSLRRDARLAQQTLGGLHSAFPTLILYEEENDFSRAFGEELVQALNRVAPRLPVKLSPVERSAPDDNMLGAKALLLPAGVALQPSEALRLWLEEYHGPRILMPEPREGWVWLGQPAMKNPRELARIAAQAIRQMAEGESPRPVVTVHAWAVAGAMLGGFLVLILLVSLLSVMIPALFR